MPCSLQTLDALWCAMVRHEFCILYVAHFVSRFSSVARNRYILQMAAHSCTKKGREGCRRCWNSHFRIFRTVFTSGIVTRHSEVKGFVVGLKWGAGPGFGCFKCETACMETGANNCVVRLELVLGDPGRPWQSQLVTSCSGDTESCWSCCLPVDLVDPFFPYLYHPLSLIQTASPCCTLL